MAVTAAELSVEAQLGVVLIAPPGASRDGRRLQLELDGYEVTATWDIATAAAAMGAAAFVYLVLREDHDLERWLPVLAAPRSCPLLIVAPSPESVLGRISGIADDLTFVVNAVRPRR